MTYEFVQIDGERAMNWVRVVGYWIGFDGTATRYFEPAVLLLGDAFIAWQVWRAR